MTCFTSLPCLSSHSSRCRKRTWVGVALDGGVFAGALLPRFMASFCAARASTTSLRQMRMLASRENKENTTSKREERSKSLATHFSTRALEVWVRGRGGANAGVAWVLGAPYLAPAGGLTTRFFPLPFSFITRERGVGEGAGGGGD